MKAGRERFLMFSIFSGNCVSTVVLVSFALLFATNDVEKVMPNIARPKIAKTRRHEGEKRESGRWQMADGR